MPVDKPENIKEYKDWLKAEHQVEITSRIQTYYERVTEKMLKDVENSAFWIELREHLSDVKGKYLLSTGYGLFVEKNIPQLKVKPFDSFLLKTFRRNVLENVNWPEEPEGGYLLPDNWFVRIKDIVRTVFVVKYLDGVAFLIESLKGETVLHGMPFDADYEAREEGYYAAHVYTKHTCEIPKENWDSKMIPVTIELQITTQLQEVIRKLLHKYYEERRKQTQEAEVKWQWEYRSDEFAANYLGHILHYVEGMIMDVREKQKEATV